MGIHASKNFYFTVHVDVVRVKSYVSRLFDPACVTNRITINKLYFIPKRVVSGVVGASSEMVEVWVQANRIESSFLAGSIASLGRTSCDFSVVSDLKTAPKPCCCRQRRSCSDRPLT